MCNQQIAQSEKDMLTSQQAQEPKGASPVNALMGMAMVVAEGIGAAASFGGAGCGPRVGGPIERGGERTGAGTS
jgi:hypothetical protein